MEQMLNRIRKIYMDSDESLENAQDKLEEYSLYKTYTESIDLNNLNSTTKQLKNEFITAALCSIRKDEPFYEFKEKVEKFNTIDEKSDDSINVLIHLCKRFIKANLLEEVSSIPLLDEKPETIEKIISEHQDEYIKIYQNGLIDSLSALHIALRRTLCDTEEQRKIFFEILKEYPEDFLNILSVVSNPPLEDSDITSKSISQKELFKKNGISALLKKYIEAIVDKLTLLIYEIKEKCTKEESFLKKCIKIEKYISDAKDIKNIEITHHFFESLENNEVKFNVIRHILYKNRDLYLTIEKKLEEEEKKSELEKAFNESIFSFKDLTNEQVKLLTSNANINDIKKMLQIFSNFNFKKLNKTNFPIVDVLLTSNHTTVNNINKFYSQNLINEDFIINHPEIFVKKIPNNLKDIINLDCKADDFYSNINCLRERKANILEISINNPSLLLEESLILERNLKLLDQYGINYEKARKLNIANNINLVGYLDIFIELGLYTYIKNNPDFIEENMLAKINRILICKELGISFTDKKRLSNNITGNNFKIGDLTINDSDLFNYIDLPVFRYANPDLFKLLCSNQSFEIKETNTKLEELEQYKKNEQIYDINGVLVSKNKVLKNYEILSNANLNIPNNELIFNAIIFGSLYNSNDLENLCNSMNIKTGTITYKKTL